MTVAGVLVVVLFQVFNVASTAWQHGETQIDAFREARGALTTMTRDFSFAIPQFPTNALTATIPPGSVRANDPPGNPVFVLDAYAPADLPRDDYDKFNEEAYFLSALPNNGASLLCAVGLFCVWMPDVSVAPARAPHAYALYRQFLPSGNSSNKGLFDLLSINAGKNPLEFLDIFARAKPSASATVASSPKPLAFSTELASYIWDLQFRINTNLTAMRGAAQPPKDNTKLYGGTSDLSYAASATQYPALLPQYVEIRFKALSATAVRQIEGNGSITKNDWATESSVPNSNYARLIRPSLQQFVLRVPLLNSRPLP